MGRGARKIKKAFDFLPQTARMNLMSILLKKIVLSFLSGLLLLLSTAPLLSVKAQSQTAEDTNTTPGATWYNAPFNDWYKKVYDPSNPSEIFGERYTAAQVQWVIYGLWGFLINTTTGPQNAKIVQCFLNNAVDISVCSDALQELVERADSGSVAEKSVPSNQNLWSLVFADRPLSGVSYVREKFGSFKLVPEVHAQTVGFGFGALKPIQGMWKAFRDIAFGLFVIVAVVFAFMIMFRIKLSPQTVISVQSALPKIVVSLLLVTFSYAIAGFLVDLMYVVIGLLSLVASKMFSISVGFVNIGPSQYFNLLTLGQPLGLNIQATVFGLVIIFFAMFFLPLLLFLILAGLPLLLVDPSGSVYFIFEAVMFIIAVIIALWTGIKVVWALLKAFVNVILLTIFAPIQITIGAIVPGLDFGQWLRSYVSNLAVFVVTGALFLFSFLFIILGVWIGFTGPSIPTGTALAILKPLLGGVSPMLPSMISGSPWPPLLGTGSSQWVGLLFLGVSFVLFTLTPKANEIIQGLLSGKPFAYGSAIGEAFGGVGAAYSMSGAKDYIGAIQSIRQSRIWHNILSTKQGKQVTRTLVGGEVEKGKSNAQAVTEAMAQNKRGH